MIPKKIHYCWFGGNPKSELINKCIDSWKKYAPDFEIIEWNEDNFDIHKYKYAEQAYEIKKYAFVSDVARFDVLMNEGGIYLDTDVELLKPIDEFIKNEMFMGYDQKGLVASGLIMGSIKQHPILEKILEYYSANEFLLSNGRPNTTTVVTIVSDILTNLGFALDGEYANINGVVVYPFEYFDPFDYENNVMRISSNTHSIHHYAASWKSKKDMRIYKIGMAIKRIVGKESYDKIARLKHKILG